MPSTALRPLLRLPTTTHHHPLLRLPSQSRGARLLKRPKRPHLLDQIVILSDGSSFKQLTTSPKGILRTVKDVRNHPIWNASDALLAGLVEDDAGKMKRFRSRFGLGFEIEEGEDSNLMDLFSSFGDMSESESGAAAAAPVVQTKKDKKGKK